MRSYFAYWTQSCHIAHKKNENTLGIRKFAFMTCRLYKCGVKAKLCFFCQGYIPAFPVWGFICSVCMLAIAAKGLKSACDLFNHIYAMYNLRVALRTCLKSTRATADVCASCCKTSASRLLCAIVDVHCWATMPLISVLFMGNVHSPYLKHE